MIHRLKRQQIVPSSLDEVWAYFATPANLNEMTPSNMHFEIIHGGDGEMFQGQLIEYRVQFMPMIKSRWLTEIAHVVERSYFVDDQRVGPYTFWYHEHTFEALKNGTQIQDQVTYQLPFGVIGDIVHALWVGPRLKSVFDFRQKIISELFGTSK